MFCKHNPEVVSKTYAVGPGSLGQVSYSRAEDLIKLVNGVTTVILKCTKCGKIWKEEMIGKEIK